MTPEEEQRRGSLARQVLGSPIYQEAHTVIRERILQQLSQAELSDDKRNRLNYLLIALGSVQKYMQNIMDGGKMAGEQIERDRTFAERVKDKIRSVA
jgi:hypothetical protein